MLGCGLSLQALVAISVPGVMQISCQQRHHNRHGTAGTVSLVKFSSRAEALISLSCGILALRCDRSRQPKAWIFLGDSRVIMEISCRHYSSRTLPGGPFDHCKRHHWSEITHTIHHTEPCAFRLLLLLLRRLRTTTCRLLLVWHQHLQWSAVRVCCSRGDMAFVRQRPKSPPGKRQHHDANADRYEHTRMDGSPSR